MNIANMYLKAEYQSSIPEHYNNRECKMCCRNAVQMFTAAYLWPCNQGSKAISRLNKSSFPHSKGQCSRIQATSTIWLAC